MAKTRGSERISIVTYRIYGTNPETGKRNTNQIITKILYAGGTKKKLEEIINAQIGVFKDIYNDNVNHLKITYKIENMNIDYFQNID